RNDCRRRLRPCRPDLHSVLYRAEAGLSLLGMAARFPWVFLYKVVAAAVLNLLGHLYLLFYQNLLPLTVSNLVTKLPLLVVLVVLNIYVLFQIPSITNAILSGHSNGGGLNPLSAIGLLKFLA